MDNILYFVIVLLIASPVHSLLIIALLFQISSLKFELDILKARFDLLKRNLDKI